jgi:hypothetical protein
VEKEYDCERSDLMRWQIHDLDYEPTLELIATGVSRQLTRLLARVVLLPASAQRLRFL